MVFIQRRFITIGVYLPLVSCLRTSFIFRSLAACAKSIILIVVLMTITMPSALGEDHRNMRATNSDLHNYREIHQKWFNYAQGIRLLNMHLETVLYVIIQCLNCIRLSAILIGYMHHQTIFDMRKSHSLNPGAISCVYVNEDNSYHDTVVIHKRNMKPRNKIKSHPRWQFPLWLTVFLLYSSWPQYWIIRST